MEGNLDFQTGLVYLEPCVHPIWQCILRDRGYAGRTPIPPSCWRSNYAYLGTRNYTDTLENHVIVHHDCMTWKKAKGSFTVSVFFLFCNKLNVKFSLQLI